MEFGGVLLSKEAAWLPVCCVRTSVVNELPGGISQLAACILDDIFNSSKANPEMLGVQLQGPDEKLYRLRFTLGCFLQDGLAHKMLFSVKGDNGTRCCILCQNVLAKGVELETATLAEVFCQERDLVLSTDADFSRSIATIKNETAAAWQRRFQSVAASCRYHIQPCSFSFSAKPRKSGQASVAVDA